MLSAAIGLSRIYLRAHYWSDVAGGWALGVGIFGLLAAIALVVEYVRHNEREPPPRLHRAPMTSTSPPPSSRSRWPSG